MYTKEEKENTNTKLKHLYQTEKITGENAVLVLRKLVEFKKITVADMVTSMNYIIGDRVLAYKITMDVYHKYSKQELDS